MEINLEKNEERMADVINIENVAEVQPVVTSDELKTEPVGTTPPAEITCKNAPKRQRCCWITVGFVVLFAAVMMVQVNSEEKRLERDFGNDYLTYKAKTRKLIPFIW